uniref:Regulatory protein SIR2 homolog 7 n=1 Tax=Arcella intermedia TaxID=1963864 RepID=A0A6B2LCP3_9EUKA
MEFEESEAEVSRKVKEVAKLVQEGKHVVFYSGAGISTSANIPDFRGPEGVWTLKDKGKLLEEGKIIPIDQIKPTYAHYAITHLLRKRWVHFVITTNMDALHLRSGTPPHLLIEQHGNSFKEICSKCKMTFLRSYMVTETVEDPRVHTTGRRCTFCGGELMDTIVHFSEAFRGMHDEVISLYHARKADVAVVMGTSMNVQPNASFPDLCFQNEGKLVIVNLQKTPYDNVAAVRVFARTDVFMRKLMEEMKEEEFDRETDLRETWDGDGSAGGSEDGSCIIS